MQSATQTASLRYDGRQQPKGNLLKRTIKAGLNLVQSDTMTERSQNGKCPDYLQTIVQPIISSHPGLRSAACLAPKFVTPRLRTKFGERAFSYAGPSAWISLPSDVRCTTETQTFKTLLKSYLFAKLLTFFRSFQFYIVRRLCSKFY